MARLSTLARFEVSGEILSEETVALLTARDCRLAGADLDVGDCTAAWELLSERWQAIRQEVAEYDTERLRHRWIIPLLELLGHDPQFLKAHTDYGDGHTVPLTHRSRNVPFWLLGWTDKPDERQETGRRRASTHEQFQQYLDQAEEDWGVICNGKTIRLLHDYHKTLTRNYVEADLESIFDALDVDGFRAVWRVFRARQFQPDGKGVLPIEKLRDQSRQDGAEIGKELRKQVLEAIRTLGNGFLAADRTGNLRATLQTDPNAVSEFYQALLRIVYRLLFLLYIENKPGWTPAASPIWASSYSITRLREQAEEGGVMRADGEDHWEGLKVVFGIIRDGSEAFGIHPYGGELFNDERLGSLQQVPLRNSDLLRAIWLLTVFERGHQAIRVNFRTLRIDALGSVYEALLDVAPTVSAEGVFTFAEGTDRKLTGSYYTPPELVAELIQSALIPVILDRLKNATIPADQEAALLGITVVDPACGSGAFLLQALDTLAERLCLVRTGGEEPSDLDIRRARRDVVTHCIHGVDLNPMAVELCKFTLWLHVAHPKLPLSYLEPLIKCGNALVGVPLFGQVERAKAKIEEERKSLLARGDRKAAAKLQYVGWPETLPDEAFDAVAGDAKDLAKSTKARNKQQRGGQLTLQSEAIRLNLTQLAAEYEKVKEVGEDKIEAVLAKNARYHTYQQSREYSEPKLLADLWCAAFYWRLDAAEADVPTQEWLRRAQANPDSLPETIPAELDRITSRVRPFHWEIEFPDVFQHGGFDCVLGNPPWERIKLQEEEFFATRAPAISLAPNKAARQRMIDALDDENPALLRDFQDAKHAAECDSKFMRQSGRFPLTAVGDINTYALFSETGRVLLNQEGRAGIIVPTGIATDDTTKVFFGDLVSSRSLCSLFGFENEGGLFPGVHHAFKFVLLTIGDQGGAVSELAFLCRYVPDCHDPKRRFHLTSDEFSLINPNTRTCPVFRTRADADLTRAIYGRVPVLWDEGLRQNSWGISFMRMLDMANDSDLFKDAPAEDRLPLYEAKMLHQFDHRWSTYEGATSAQLAVGTLPQPTQGQKVDPSFTVTPRYWVENWDVWERVSNVPMGLVAACRSGAIQEVCFLLRQSQITFPVALDDAEMRAWTRHLIIRRCPRWLLGFRDITSNVVTRTAIFSLLPLVGVGHTTPIMSIKKTPEYLCCLLSNVDSLTFDYITRQKVSGTHLTYGYLRQLPVLSPQSYSEADIAFIFPRALELVYTAWDMQPFAQDMGYDGPPFTWDEEHRALIRAELDVYYARLYGLTRKQIRYILDPRGLSDAELANILDPWEDPTCAGPHLLPAEPTEDFPGETFRVLKNSDMAKYGDYRTRRLVLDAWARLEAELGPAEPRNYHDLLETQLPKAIDGQKATNGHSGVSDGEFKLVPPDWTPQGRLPI